VSAMQTLAQSNPTIAPRPPLAVYPTQHAEQSIQQLAHLPADHLVQAHADLNALMVWSAQIRAKLDAAIELRVGNAARQSLVAMGQIFGEATFDDGDLRVRFHQPHSIQWDQARLRHFAQRVAEAGDQVENFLNVQFSVDEARFQRWALAAGVGRAGADRRAGHTEF
jgi:hypothetical protein